MLAQNFKTAKELGLPKEHHAALIKTLAMMDSGKLTHIKDFRMEYTGPINFTSHFNMAEWVAPSDCGTVCCIGGTAEYVGGVNFNPIKFQNRAINELFFPYKAKHVWLNITVEQAAMALRSYLTTGRAHWELVE